MRLLPAVIACALALSAREVSAKEIEDATDSDIIARPESGSYFSLAFAGGVLMPDGDIAERYDPGLTAQLSFGFTSSFGLGISALVAYSPLRGQPLPGTSRESHLGQAVLAPRYVLGDGTLRVWVAAGGGAVALRERTETGELAAETQQDIEPLAAGSAGLELHVFESGGIGVAGRYSRSFGQLAAELYSITGGLVLTFH